MVASVWLTGNILIDTASSLTFSPTNIAFFITFDTHCSKGGNFAMVFG